MLILTFSALAFDVDRAQLPASTLTGAGTLARPAPFLDEPGSFYVGALASLAEAPLRFATGEPVISRTFGVDLGFGFTVGRRVRVDAAMDLVPSVTYPQHDWSVELERMALGDTRLGGQVVFFAPVRDGLALALDAHARLATGSPFFTRGWGGQARLLFGGRHGRVGWNVDAGADYADEPAFLGRQVGSSVVGGAGVHVWPLETVVVGAELDVRHAVAPLGSVVATSSEWNGYVGYAPCTGAQVTLGGGAGAVAGVGTPDARLLLSFGYFQGGCSRPRLDPAVAAVLPAEAAVPAPAPAALPATLTATEVRPGGPIGFRYRSAWLLPESEPVLRGVAALLSAHPELRLVEVQAHTGRQGGDEFNLQLSVDRADAVVAWLVAAGVGRERLLPRGYGATQPLAAGQDEAAETRNARVELRVIEAAP